MVIMTWLLGVTDNMHGTTVVHISYIKYMIKEIR